MRKRWNTFLRCGYVSRWHEAIHLQFHHSTRLIFPIITTETIILLCMDHAAFHVLTMVLIKHLVSERKYSRKYDNTLQAHIY